MYSRSEQAQARLMPTAVQKRVSKYFSANFASATEVSRHFFFQRPANFGSASRDSFHSVPHCVHTRQAHTQHKRDKIRAQKMQSDFLEEQRRQDSVSRHNNSQLRRRKNRDRDNQTTLFI